MRQIQAVGDPLEVVRMVADPERKVVRRPFGDPSLEKGHRVGMEHHAGDRDPMNPRATGFDEPPLRC